MAVKIPEGNLSQELRRDLKFLTPHQFIRGKYTHEIDCTPVGICARLHYRCLAARDRHHKAELYGVGTRGLSYMIREIEKLTPSPPEELKIMRLDLAAEDRTRPVEWYRYSVRRVHRRYFLEIRSRLDAIHGMTLQFGNRPDCLRIYDKIAELRNRYSSYQRRSLAPSPFQVWSGSAGDHPWTRVERQYTRTLPATVRTLADLPRVVQLKPFSVLLFRPVGHPPGSPDQFTLHEWITGTWLRNSIETHGYEATRAFVNRWGRNFHRMELRYRVFLNNDEPPDLDSLFVAGVTEQLRS